MKKQDKNNNEVNQETNTPEEKSKNPFFGSKPAETVDESTMASQQKSEQEVSTESTDQINKLKAENKQMAEEMEALKNQYLRLAADFDNFRKRQDQMKQDLYRTGAADAVNYLMPVMDTFDRAYASFQSLDDPEKLKESFNVVYRQMQDSLAKIQVVKVKTAGELFDPNYHQAVMREETEEYDDDAIVAELQPGYMLYDKLIRPAMVKVASNPARPRKAVAREEQQEN
jgi:molecular chaperone GrpE